MHNEQHIAANVTTERPIPLLGNVETLTWVGRITAILIILAGFLWLTMQCSPFVIDDAFISFRYAENLVHGNGLVFNIGERVEGYTNFLWVMLIAGVNVLGGTSLFWSKALGVVLNLGTLLVVARTAMLWWPRPAIPGLAFIPPLLLTADYGFVLWGVGGLETPLFTLLVTSGLLLMVAAAQTPTLSSDPAGSNDPRPERLHFRPEGTTRPLYLAALLLALATLTRPDGAVLFIGGLLGVVVWRLRCRSFHRAFLGHILIAATVFTLIVLAHTLFRYLYYGEIVPNTVYIKAPSEAVLSIHWAALADWLRPWGLIDPAWLSTLDQWTGALPWWWKLALGLVVAPALWIMLVGLWSGRRQAYGWIGGITCALWLLYLARVNADWMPGWRYYQPILPVCTLLIASGLNYLMSRARNLSSEPHKYLACGAVVAVLMCFVVFSLGDFRNRMGEIYSHSSTQTVYREAGEFLRAHAAPNESIALTDAGAIPYYSGLYTIDYYGLLDKHMARVPLRPITLDKGDGIERYYPQMRYDTDYLLSRRPDFVQLVGTMLPNGRLVVRYPELAHVRNVLEQHGGYDLDHPVFSKGNLFIVRRKDAIWKP